jgi:hypothetical protein
VKKAIELLERAEGAIMLATAGKPDSSDLELCTEAINYINDAMAELKSSPRWETPEQWEKRTGDKYPDKAPVWCADNDVPADPWFLEYHENAVDDERYYIICAVGGLVPPDSWRPEKTE